ncbi:hypothetical protein PRZ48_004491 [Zasmidium cellare]|uniref:Metallo-beta-lactamase domain-containing protein n=1 Tax=Zasmidium cellare TaxID=395010 RepID=A0ABR0EQQ3_ZASCE|nr:hypothetical protein PRZ48_004491 [Zasmidium cellare]
MAENGRLLTMNPPPPSNNTVRVRMIDTTATLTAKAECFLRPKLPGHDLLSMTAVAFLIEHEGLGKKAMFDLGVRKDFWNYPPAVARRLETVIPGIKVDRDVTEILEEGGCSLDRIDDIIWSHSHWDHTGSTFLFPKSTRLVYGKGTGPFPAYPEDPNSPLNSNDFEGRPLLEIKYTDLRIGPFPAHDFYGDGSLYLLDSPGHLPGHLCALARTTPDTFVFLGGDICHFAGDFRPSAEISLPDYIPEDAFAVSSASKMDGKAARKKYPMPCPCSISTDPHPQKTLSPDVIPERTPFFQLSRHEHSSYKDPDVAEKTLLSMQEHFDSDLNVLVLIAHDPSLLVHVPSFNHEPSLDLNGWKEKGWKEKCHWGWLGELPRHAKDGSLIGPGMREKPIVEGVWRNGVRVNGSA